MAGISIGIIGCADNSYDGEDSGLVEAVRSLDTSDPRVDFVRPRGLATHKDGYLMLDVGTAQLVELDLDLEVEFVWGQPGMGPNELAEPIDVSVAAEAVVVVLERGRRSLSYWTDGRLLERVALPEGDSPFTIDSPGNGMICWPSVAAFMTCHVHGEDAPTFLGPVPNGDAIHPFPTMSLLRFGVDSSWYRMEHKYGALYRLDPSGSVEALRMPPELTDNLAIPDDLFNSRIVSLGFGGVRDFAVSAEGIAVIALQHPRTVSVVGWDLASDSVFPIFLGSQPVHAVRLSPGGDLVTLRDEALMVHNALARFAPRRVEGG